jgi:type 1 fimbriae regulatory protein FimB/type 1 fimbriae regulatory protein FimE
MWNLRSGSRSRTTSGYRSKKGKRAIHDITVEEVKALKKLTPEPRREGIVFLSEKGNAIARRTWFDIVQRAGKVAGIKRPIHPHCLRHGCGFYMADKGTHMRLIQDWLGHRRIQTTVLYTDLAPGKLKGAFPDEE